MLNLDTHILIHLVEGTLSGPELQLVNERPLGISSIVLWEIAKLKQLSRIAYGLDDPRFAELIAHLVVWEIDSATAIASTRLDFRSDPADELIAATSLVRSVPLLTRDDRIRGSELVPLAIR